MTKHLIHVTSQDIEDGIPCQNNCCPVALALKRHFNAEFIHVEGTNMLSRDIEIDDLDLDMSDLNAIRVGSFIRSFDMHEQVLPFEFEIYVE